MADRTLPHDPYIAAVIAGLTVAGLAPDAYWTSDAETNPYNDGPEAGLTTMLNAVVTWDADEDTDRDGLILLWDHPAEQWQYAWPRSDGGNTEADFLPRLGRWSHPDAVVETARALLTGQPVPAGHAPYWHQADAVQTAVTAWEQGDAADTPLGNEPISTAYLSRFSALPAEIHSFLARHLAEDVHLRYQQAIGSYAVEQAAKHLRMAAACQQAAGEVTSPREYRAAADDVDPMKRGSGGPFPTELIHFGTKDGAADA